VELELFGILLRSCLLTWTGYGNLPLLRDDFTARGWGTDAQVTDALLIGQVAPGPTGLWVVSFGYLTFGWVGGVLALIASALPPLLVLLAARVRDRLAAWPATGGFLRGLAMATTGVGTVILPLLLVDASHRAGAAATFGLAAVCCLLGLHPRVPPWAILLGGATLGGVLWPRLA
jgi:chromate transporter